MMTKYVMAYTVVNRKTGRCGNLGIELRDTPEEAMKRLLQCKGVLTNTQADIEIRENLTGPNGWCTLSCGDTVITLTLDSIESNLPPGDGFISCGRYEGVDWPTWKKENNNESNT